MRDVPVPLSIAWFAADGRFVSATDMPPCPDRDGCPTYGAAAPYRYAVEVLQGGLSRLGLGEGSRARRRRRVPPVTTAGSTGASRDPVPAW